MTDASPGSASDRQHDFSFGERVGISKVRMCHWLQPRVPHVQGEAFQESQVLSGQVLVQRKEAGPVISPRLCDIAQVEGRCEVWDPQVTEKVQRSAILHLAQRFPVMSAFDLSSRTSRHFPEATPGS